MPFFSKKLTNPTSSTDGVMIISSTDPEVAASNNSPQTDYNTMSSSDIPDGNATNRSTNKQQNKRPGMKKEKSIFQDLDPKNDKPMPPLNPSEQRAYETAKRLQYIMDDCIKIPSWWCCCCLKDRRIGIDPIIGMIPGFGDFGSAMISLAIVARMAPVLSRYTVLRMLVNVWIDAVTGVFPIIGDIFDFGWKANQRNVLIFEDHMKNGGEQRHNTDRRWVIMVALGFFLFCFLTVLCTLGLCIAIIIIIF